MPELPEVEVTRRELSPKLVGRTITQLATTRASYFFLTPPALLRRALVGRRVEGLVRLGKYLIVELDDGARLLLHLGMTGQLFFSGDASLRLLSALRGVTLAPEAQARGFVPDAHTHLVFHFVDTGPALYFRDVRKFGKVELLEAGKSSKRLDKLGPDALGATGEQLHRAAKSRSVPAKTLLLDQSVLAGIGNIYADEALFLAGLSPLRRASRLRASDCDALVRAVQQVMRRSIETGGTSMSDYVRPDGERGGYQHERRVYGRTGQPCLSCGTALRRRVIATRSTHYCPRCQPR